MLFFFAPPSPRSPSLLVGELLERHQAQSDAQPLGNGGRQLGVGVAGEHLDVGHVATLWREGSLVPRLRSAIEEQEMSLGLKGGARLHLYRLAS